MGAVTDKEPGSEFGPESGSAPYPAGQPPAAQQPPTEAELAAFRQWKAWQEQQYPPQQAPPPVPYDPGYPAPLPSQGQGGQFTGQQPGQPGQPGVQAELALVREQLTALQQSQERVERATNPPLWKRILRSAPVRWVVGLIVVIAIASWAIDHYFGGGGEEDSPQAKFPLARPQQQVKVGVDSPKDAVAELYREVGMAAASPGSAAELGKHACLMFNDQAARKFAQQHGAPDCAQALGRITVPDPDSYREVSLKGLPETPNQATSTTIDSCSFPVNGGPKLGTFTLSVVHENKWLITDVTPSHCG